MMRVSIKELKYFIGSKGLKWLMAGLIASLALSVIEYAIAIYFQYFLASIGLIETEKLPLFMREYVDLGILYSCLLFVLLGVTRALFLSLSNQSGQIFAQIVNTRLRSLSIYELLIKKSQIGFSASTFHLRFGEIFPKTGSFLNYLSSSILNLVQAILIAGIMIYIAPKEAIAGIVALLFLGFIVKFLQEKIFDISKGILDEQDKITKSIERVTKNWFFLKISKTEDIEYELLTEQNLNHFNHIARSSLFGQLSSVIPSLVGILLLSILIFVSQSIFKTEPTNLVTFLYLFLRFVQQASLVVDRISLTTIVAPQFIESYKYFLSFDKNSLEEAFSYEHLMHAVREKKEKFIYAKSKPALDKKNEYISPYFKIDNIGYTWKQGDPEVLKDLSIEIPRNSILGIKGRSGSGKSTLLSLLFGMLQPNSGSIEINCLDPKTYLERNYSSIGYVGTDSFMIEGDIRKNLEYGQKEKYSDKEIFRVFELVGLEEEIQSLGGLDYQITESGEGLSTGQKQRLSFARALLKKPKLLILDEATANLDTENEKLIAEYLMEIKKGCTIIIVSHRPKMLEFADNILTLSESGFMKSANV